ncbi:MAG: 1-deoxy-D-xylulose-5-phosphate synthase [Clostridia bacterium]|nr:1-deoxy-D-xylulose-5-phosphate synthase [Clostridia bacterium]
MYETLDGVNSPEDIKALSHSGAYALCEDIRKFLVEKVTQNGGHLASNLGVVELTVALHRVFDIEKDRIIFDVGHQSYTHKLLTGRRENFDTLRKTGGLSGFTNRAESKYDPFGAGHSSTSISAALGFCEADRLSGSDSTTVAVIGDGAFTGGMVHEALNNCHRNVRLVVVLNENEMSISKNTGRFAKLIARMRVSKKYVKTKRATRSFLKGIPLFGNFLFRLTRKIKRILKAILVRPNYFEQMGFAYIGPADGHDIEKMEMIFSEAKNLGRPVLVHLRTVKGKGYAPAEKSPTEYHSYYTSKSCKPTFNSVLCDTLCDMAQNDERICAVTAAMGAGTGLDRFCEKYKDRFFDVGIAEEHALTFSAGLAAAGKRPYFGVYSTFLQRGYDNILHDIALQSLPVTVCIDRAGLAVSDGATHHGIFDVAFLSHVPSMTLYAPQTFGSMAKILEHTKELQTPVAIRYSNAPENERIVNAFYPDGDFDSFGVRTDTSNFYRGATVITYGKIAERALDAAESLRAEGIPTQVILLEQLCPYAETAEKIKNLLPESGKIIFLEEGIRNGGAGMIIGEALSRVAPERYAEGEYEILAIDNSFANPTEPCDLYEYCGIDAGAVCRAVKNYSKQELRI